MLPVLEQPQGEGYGVSGERGWRGEQLLHQSSPGKSRGEWGWGAGWAKRGGEARGAAETRSPTFHSPPAPPVLGNMIWDISWVSRASKLLG